MAGVTQDPEAWTKLGQAFRESREARGSSRKALAEMAGVSEKSIQVAEEGRVPRGRMPQSLARIAGALGWPPGAVTDILSGAEPGVVLMQPSLFDSVERDQKEGRVTQQADSAPTMPTRVGFRDLELMESSILAQDTFMRQMKRYRKKQGVSLAEVARSIAELQGDLPPGESLGVAELEKLENGTRLPKGAEGELIANALGTTVEWLLGSTFMDGVPEYLKEPPTDEELQAEAKAMEQRMVRVGMRVNGARNQYAMAREREDEARRQASWAQAILENAASEQRKLEQQYQYLLGRIDSIRAAKGEDLVVQVHPVYGDD